MSFDMDLACGSRALEEATLEGTWASLILSTESNEECFSGTIGWWGALVLKELPQKHCHEESTVQVTTQREELQRNSRQFPNHTNIIIFDSILTFW